MRIFISCLFLIVVAVSVEAAEFEKFTLSDGRVMSGYYDENEQAIIIPGKIKASVKVRKEDIVKREPDVAPPPPEELEKEEAKKAEKNPPSKRLRANLEALAQKRSEEKAKIDKEDEASLKVLQQAVLKIVTPMKPYNVTEPKDPTRSELETLARARRYNDFLKHLQIWAASDRPSEWARLYQELSKPLNLDLISEFGSY